VETISPYLEILFGFLHDASTEIIVALIAVLIWYRIGRLGKSIRAMNSENLSKLELFVDSEKSLHDRLESVLAEIREFKSR
jgi:hypothetical protein